MAELRNILLQAHIHGLQNGFTPIEEALAEIETELYMPSESKSKTETGAVLKRRAL